MTCFKLFAFLCLVFSTIATQSQTLDSVHNYIKLKDIRYPDIVVRQAILETGWLLSPHLMRRNNLFAFRFNKTYMRFETWQASVDYYKQWQLKFYTNEKEDYYIFLKRIKYAQSPSYVSVLKKIKLP